MNHKLTKTKFRGRRHYFIVEVDTLDAALFTYFVEGQKGFVRQFVKALELTHRQDVYVVVRNVSYQKFWDTREMIQGLNSPYAFLTDARF